MGCLFYSSGKNNAHQADRARISLEEIQIEPLIKMRFDRQEIFDWYRSFTEKCSTNEKTDRHASPSIDKSTFINYFQQLHPNGNIENLIEKLFLCFDSNRDGKIDFIEFMNTVAVLRRGDLAEKLCLIFSLIDSNQRGFIDRVKFIEVIEAIYQAKGLDYKDVYNGLLRKIDEFIDKCQQEKEGGRVNRYKFIEMCLNDDHFKEILEIYR